MAGIRNYVPVCKYIPQTGHKCNFMISKCDEDGYIGKQYGLNSGGWVIIKTFVKDEKGKVVDVIWKSICPKCAEKYFKPTPPAKRRAEYTKPHHFEEED